MGHLLVDDERMVTAPGPVGRPLVGSLPDLAPPLTRMQTILGWTRRYGEVVRVRLGSRVNYVLTSPTAIKHVLLDNAKNYPKSPAYDTLKALLGDGLLTASGQTWLTNRRMIQPYFHQKYIAGLLPTMVACTETLLADWQGRAARGEVVDVSAQMMALALRVVSKTLLSADVTGTEAGVGEALATGLELANARIFAPFQIPEWLPTPNNRRFVHARGVLDGVVLGIIRARRATPGQGDLLDMLLAARDEETGDGLSDHQVRDEVMTIFLAGHETTATALTWTLYLLSRHPDVARKLRAEVAAVLGDRVPTLEDLGKLRYTTMVLEEAMRLYPPIYVIQRQALADDVVDGFTIKAGELVTANMFATHRNPKYWENPEGFDPERFAPENSADRPKFAYLPFGGGGRVCIGNNFAMMEGKVLLAMICRAFHVDALPGQPVVPWPVVTLRVKDGLQATLRAI
ncbi:MAG: cytochrome [Cyanobacteria bacterium RYN_339]|nr:cytochrome [Cyanobacteria bacterium RYN_339]